MKANELRIGNRVNLYGSEATIIPNDFEKWFQYEPNWESKAFKPILLTEEWFLKFGTKKNENNDLFIQHPTNELLRFYLVDGFIQETKSDCCPISNYKHIKYVHQLQNLYFALTGNELEIK